MTGKRAGSLIFLAAGVYGLIFSLRLPMGEWSQPGAGAFPLVVSMLLCLSGVLMFVTAKERVESNWRAIVTQQRTPLQIVALTAAFIVVLDRLGYLVTSSLYVFALLFWVSRYRIWIALGLAIAIGIGSWYVFGRLFGTPLPKGLLAL